MKGAKKMRRTGLIVMFLLVVFVGHTFAQAETITGEISSVIVYRGQALVTRTIEVDSAKGLSELVVVDLPARIVPESLYSQAGDGITVLSVRYREKAVREDTRQEVKKLDNEIEQMRRQLKHADRDRKHVSNVWAKYDPFWKLTLNSANSDLDRGLLQFEPIEKLTGYLEAKYNEMHKKGLALEDTIDELKKELGLLERKRKTLAAGHSRTQREAVVYLNKAGSKPASIELSYLVDGANWTPQYNLRSRPGKSTVTIEYNAVVHQSSGEAWENAALALSTAQPSLVASPPVLEPMEITLTEMAAGYARRSVSANQPQQIGISSQAEQQVQYIDRSSQIKNLILSRNTKSKAGKRAQKELNRIAITNQMMELEADKDALKKMNEDIALIKRTEGVSVMYKLPGRLSLPSRSDQQLLTIAAITAKADFTLLATPMLTDYVYLQSEILNDSDTILLPGPASMYRNGEFVGKDDLGLVTIGQKFTAGFGIDSQIQVTREFKDKKIETLWGNRVDEHKYRIEINNYKSTPVKLRLLERLPYTENPNIEITLQKPSRPLSKDSKYLRTDRKKGILRWDLTLKANTIGEKATIIEYGFGMKYDNDMRIRAAK